MPHCKSVPLGAVRAALMCAIVRLKSRTVEGGRHGRAAAFTQVPFWEPSCRERERDRRLGAAPRRALPLHFSAMDRGDMERVVERTRLERGLQEVRRTWGIGLRALQRELAGSRVMR
jgi:hypothetical protein